MQKLSQAPEPNTFIGGVGGSYITSPADYVTKVGESLTVSDIINFKIDANNNVSFFVGTRYGFRENAFRDTDVTYFVETDNFFNLPNFRVLRFSNAVNMIALVTDNPERIGSLGGLRDYNNFGMVNGTIISKAVTLNNFAFDFVNYKYLRLEDLNNINIQLSNRSMFRNNVNAERVYLGSNIISWNYLISFPQFFDKLKSNCNIYVSNTIISIEQDAWAIVRVGTTVQVGDTVSVNGLVYTAVSGTPNEGEFQVTTVNQQNAQRLLEAINSDTRVGTIGNLRAERNVFSVFIISDQGVAGNSIPLSVNSPQGGIIIDQSFQFGGDLIFPLQRARDTWGANIIEIQDVTPPNAITDLSVSDIFSEGFRLIFTTPNSLNNLDFYEVWLENIDLGEWETERVKGRYNIYQEITASGDFVTGLQPNTNYRVWVYACDEYWNRSLISNVIQIKTTI